MKLAGSAASVHTFLPTHPLHLSPAELLEVQHPSKEAANRRLNVLLSKLTFINEREALPHLENIIKKDVKWEPLNIYESLN